MNGAKTTEKAKAPRMYSFMSFPLLVAAFAAMTELSLVLRGAVKPLNSVGLFYRKPSQFVTLKAPFLTRPKVAPDLT